MVNLQSLSNWHAVSVLCAPDWKAERLPETKIEPLTAEARQAMEKLWQRSCGRLDQNQQDQLRELLGQFTNMISCPR